MTFELTETHISLIRRLRIEPTLQSPYTDISIEINAKRPFGNSYIEGDILDIAHLGPPTEENLDTAYHILSELPIAYHIIMQYGFYPGTYELTKDMHSLYFRCLSTYVILPALTESTRYLDNLIKKEPNAIQKEVLTEFKDNLKLLCDRPINRTPISDMIHTLKFFEPDTHEHVNHVIRIFEKYKERELLTCQS